MSLDDGRHPGDHSPAASPKDGIPSAAGPVRPTALVFLSLLTGQLLNLLALSLLAAHLGLARFGRFGICMLDFAVFGNLANFALPAASITMAVKGRFRPGLFALVMGARGWTSLLAVTLYMAFEILFRDREMVWTAAVLLPALILNPAQLEWWFAAKQSWRDLLLYRLLGGCVTLGVVLLGVGRIPGLPAGGLPAAAAAYSAGFAAAALYLMARMGNVNGARLPRMYPVTARMRYLWRQSFPIALTVVCDFLFVALGYYAFTAAGESGPLLGAYACAYRIILAASMFSSSLFTVLLPRFAGHSDLANALRRVFDRMALALAALLPAVPFLARPLLRLFFPKAGWDAASLDYAAWALSTMGLATYLHLLRMPPLTKALSEGAVWLYCRRFFLAGAANVVVVAAGVFSGFARGLPLLTLTADLLFTGWWLSDLYPQGGKARWGRLGALLSGSLAYLAWVGYWV